MSISKTTRALKENFMSDLRKGKLEKLLERVKDDDTLCLELRGDRIIIYYRGGALYTIKEISDNEYEISYNKNYILEENIDRKKADYEIIPSIEQAIKDIPQHKETMDFYFAKYPKLEREFQQLILRENNNSGKVTDATDYYILDIEYAFSGNNSDENVINARYDMLGVIWPSDGIQRKNTNNLRLSFIEIKYGDGSIDSGSDVSKAGIHKHINDYIKFRKDNELIDFIASDMAKVFNQKHKLGLISSYPDKQGNLEISLSRDNPEFLLVLVNHDPAKTKLCSELEATISEWKGKDEEKYLDEIRIAESSLMGHGLYALDKDGNSRFVNIKEFCRKIVKEDV